MSILLHGVVRGVSKGVGNNPLASPLLRRAATPSLRKKNMPPADKANKAANEANKKKIEDKTFGMKNKNKCVRHAAAAFP